MKSKRVPQESDARDIGERKRLEQALHASEERLRTLLQLSFDLYWETDAEHRFTRQDFAPTLVNAPAPDSDVGKARWEVPYLEPDEEAWRQHRATLEAHLPFRDFELARPTAGGGRRDVSVSGLPVFDVDGRFLGYRGVGRDITERKRAEAQRRAHLWFLQSMDRISRAMQGTQDLERVTSNVLEATIEIFACDRAWLVQPCDPQAATWRAVMERTRPPLPPAFGSGSDVASDPDMAAIFTAARSSSEAVPTLPGPLADRFGIRSQLAMALQPQGDEPYLFGLHQSSQARTWTADEQRLFREIGGRLTDALSSLQAMRSLRESERRLKAAQGIARVGWWERDFRTGHVSLSDEASRIFGVQPLDLRQWHERWLSLIHPDDRSRVAAASEAALAGGPRYDVEYRVVRPDGTVRMVHSQGEVTRDDSGRPARQFDVMQDITALWQAQQELRARQEMLDLAQKAAHAVAFDWNIGARESENRWSPDLEAMYGLDPGTFDRTFQGWKKLVHPDDWPSVKLAIMRAHETGDVAAEYRVIHKDGSVHCLHAKGRMFLDAEGRPERMVGFMIDVTDRRQAEEELRASEARFRTFVDRATDAFFLLDDQLTVVDVNRQACEGLGYAREELIGLHPGDFDAALDEQSIALLAERAGAGETITFETQHRRRDGTVFPVEIRSGTFQQAGRLFYLALVRDITERRRAEEEHRSYLWFLESMDRINRAIQGADGVDRMMSDVLNAALEIFACDRAWIVYPCDPQAPSWRAIMEHTRPEFPGAFALEEELPTDAEVAAVFEAAQAAPGPVLFGSGYDLKIPAWTADRFAIRSQMAMAIDAKGDKRHLFGLHQCSHARVWTDQEQRLFQEIGRRLGDAVAALSMLRSLRDSERKLDAAQRIAHVGWWERDFATNRVSLSEEAQRIFGVPPVDLPKWHDRWVNLIHPEDRARTAEAAAAAMRGGPRYEVEYRVIRPDGAVRVVHSQGDVAWDESARPVRQFGVMQDITELRRAEDELRATEAYLEEAQRLSHTGSWALDLVSNRYIYTSDESDRIYGFDPQADPPTREAVFERIHPDDRSSWKQNFERSLREKVDISDEYRIVLPDGRVRHIRAIRRPVLNSAGDVVKLVGTSIDITERKVAEEELRASEARFRTFVDRATDAFFLLDEEVRVVDVNRQACESMGWSREEFIGMHPREFDMDMDEPSIERLSQRARAGEIITFETRHRRKDGSAFPVEIRTGTFKQGGQLFYLALARDITERKRAEESLRESEAYLTEAQRLSHTGSWALDVASNRYLYTSEEFDRLFGFDPDGEKPTREAVLERMHPEDRISWKRILEKSVREKLDTTSEYRIGLPDGSIRHIHTIRHPVANSAGEVVKLVGTSIDITERKRAEEERERLRQLEAELAHANRVNTLGELTTSIVHEVSQPLGAMVASAAAGARWLAAEPPDIAEARSALDNIAADGKRAREVIARIRALTQRQAPRTELLDLNRKVFEVVSLAEHELRSHDIDLQTQLDRTLPRVAGDRVQLQQVLLNLILNAIEAMSGVHDRLRQLTIVSRRDGANAVVVELRDSGTGLDPERAERVFEAFYTTKPEGIGIGLSISRSIIEAHGGRLWASTNEPHGAVFRFSLPLAEERQS